MISHLEIHDWQSQFESNHKLDHDEIISYLAEISNSQDITLAVTVEGFAKIMAFMSNMQQVCTHNPRFVVDELTYIL